MVSLLTPARLHVAGAAVCAALRVCVMDPAVTAVVLLGGLHLAFRLPAAVSLAAAAVALFRLQNRHDPLNNTPQKYVLNTGDALNLALLTALCVVLLRGVLLRVFRSEKPAVAEWAVILLIAVKFVIDNQSGLELAAVAGQALGGLADAARGALRMCVRTNDAVRSATY